MEKKECSEPFCESCSWQCLCGDSCKEHDQDSIQKSLTQGSALCACGTCEVRIYYQNGLFTTEHTKRILWSTSKLGTDINIFSGFTC